MARIIIPLNEAVKVFLSNVETGSVIKRVEATPQGPRVVIGFPPILKETGILIRFVKFENSTALFEMEGVPPFLNLNAVLKLPPGITISGTALRIQPETLLKAKLGITGIRVTGVTFDGGTYVIDASPY